MPVPLQQGYYRVRILEAQMKKLTLAPPTPARAAFLPTVTGYRALGVLLTRTCAKTS